MPTVPELFESVVARHGDNPALVFGNRVVTYRELNARANRLARVMVERGVGADATVAVAMPKCDDLVVVLLRRYLKPAAPTSRWTRSIPANGWHTWCKTAGRFSWFGQPDRCRTRCVGP